MANPTYLLDCVRIATTSGGTGLLSLGATPAGWINPFVAGAVSGRSYTWRCATEDGLTWELFDGVLTAGTPATISRDIVHMNSSGGTAKVNFAAGVTKRITCVASAKRLLYLDSAGKLPGSSIPLRTNVASSGYLGTANLAVGDTAFFMQAIPIGTKQLDISVTLRGETGSNTATTVQMIAHIRNAQDTATDATLDLGRGIVHGTLAKYFTIPGLAGYVFGAPSNGQFIRYLAKIDQDVTPVTAYEYRAVSRAYLEG